MLDRIVAIALGCFIATLVIEILLRIKINIKKEYYITFAISENGSITMGRTVMTTTGKINVKDIIDLEQSWAEENGLEHIIVQNIYLLRTYLDLKSFFRIRKKDKEQKTTDKVQAGPRLMR